MTERKPPEVRFESFVEKQIREATERGEFDDLPGTGRPIPGAGTDDDENWWIRRKLAREGEPTRAMLPMSLQLRKEIEELPAALSRLRTEAAVRDAVGELNRRIVSWMLVPTPPVLVLHKVDADAAVRRWRAERARPATPPESAAPEPPRRPPARRWRRWRAD